MKQSKNKFSTFNDGILHVCEAVKESSDFGAVKNAKKYDDLNFIAKLAYKEVTRRVEDIDFAESQGRKLNLKVKTRLMPNVSKQKEVLIEDTLYSIIKLDPSREKGEMYFYLEEVRRIERT